MDIKSTESDWEFLLRMCDKIENLKKTKPELFLNNSGFERKKLKKAS